MELAGESTIDDVLDDLHELVPDTPKVRTKGATAETDPGVMFGLDAALWRSSCAAASEGGVRPAAADEADHMVAEAECYQVLPSAVPPGWSATRSCLEKLMKAASVDELYRTKGVVPLTFAEAAAECARQGLPPPAEGAPPASQLGDTWWLFNGVAGRLTLERMASCAGPTSMVFMGQDLKLVMPDLEQALKLPKGSASSAGTTSQPRPKIKLDLSGQRMIMCGVARGLSAPEPAEPVD